MAWIKTGLGGWYTGTGGNSTMYQIAKQRTERETISVQGAHVPISSIALPLANLGVPIPYVAGRQRVFTPNIIWYGNLRPIIQREVHTETRTEVEGRWRTIGAGSIYELYETTYETTTVTETIIGYNLSMQFGLCLGPDVVLRAIYVDDEPIWEGSVGPGRTEFSVGETGTFINGEVIFSGGAIDQEPDPWLAQHILPELLPGYVGLAHLIIKDVRADNLSGRLSIEVERFPNVLELDADVNRQDDDINIASALADYLSSDWGGAGLSLSELNTISFTTAAIRLAEENNYGAFILQNESMSNSIITALTSQADGIVFENPGTGTVDFRLIRFDLLNPLTAYKLNDNTVNKIINWGRPSWVGTFNKMRVGFTSRAKNYESDFVYGYNFAAINDKIQADRSMSIDYPAATNADVAADLLARDLGGLGQPLSAVTVETNRSVADALPGDAAQFYMPLRRLGPFMGAITKIRRHAIGDNRVVVNVRQVARGDSDIRFDPETSVVDDLSIDPAAPTSVTIVQAPYWIARTRGVSVLQTQNSDFVIPMVLPVKADNVQMSFDAYITNKPGVDDPLTVIDSSPYPTAARLATAIDKFEAMDTGTISSITINQVLDSGGLLSQGETGVREGRVLMMIDNEFLAFETATDNGNGTWTLGTVHRGLLDTTPQAHSADARVFILASTASGYVGTGFNYPLGYSPGWRVVSNSVNREGDIDTPAHYIDVGTWDLTNNRVQAPLRPHDTKIDGADRSDSLTNELGEVGTIVTRGQNIDVTWRTRNRATFPIQFQLDAAAEAEFDAEGTVHYHRVMIRDSGNTLRDCGATADDATYNALTATVPASTALGLGYLFVRAESIHGQSLYEDHVPVFVLNDLWYSPEDDATQYYVSEDGLSLYVGEGV